jgi:hypothetical protein
VASIAGKVVIASRHSLPNTTGRVIGRMNLSGPGVQHRQNQLAKGISAVDLEKKLAASERFYNYDRPHGAHNGKTPYELCGRSQADQERPTGCPILQSDPPSHSQAGNSPARRSI